MLSDGGISPPASYQAVGQFDGVLSSTSSAPAPDRDGGTVIGWEQIISTSTTTTTVLIPPARVGAAIGNNGSQILMYGGAAPDVDGGTVDTAGTWYSFNPSGGAGWTSFQQPPNGSNPFPSTSFGSQGVASPTGRVGAAMGIGGSLSCTPSPCTTTQHRVMAAGGATSAGALTDRIYAYGDKVFAFTGGSNTYTGWWDLSVEFGGNPPNAANRLPVPNAGMAYAPMSNIPMPVGGNSFQQHTGAVLVGGVNVPAGAAWDANACQIVVGLPFTSTAGAAGTAVPCTTLPEFATTTGTLGFRSGVALTASDANDGSVYLFGGNRSGATTSSLNGFKNDLWQGTIKVDSKTKAFDWTWELPACFGPAVCGEWLE